ncbi:hypothetical protein OG357_00875 [Streptomyces sp. NBC_01255]|uniref:hypothetical protein n=1 Tax=Streptomyces sp. NBC_01255 TaxID=2903798 RepID=UPI002E30E641|nr:hypothetical protein [Streptomyces sp. NBC_01255]
MDLFDGELGGRDDNNADVGGSCSWVTVVIVGILVLVVVLANWLWDQLHRLI